MEDKESEKMINLDSRELRETMYRNLLLFFVLNVFYLHIDSAVISCEPPDSFLCENKRCISVYYRCNGENDCGDESDEKDCKNTNVIPNLIQCATDEYQCKNNFCIPIEKFCDTKHDCSDGEDEYDGCVKDLKCDSFRCTDGHCVKNEWVCDGVTDCPDGSDEGNCGNETIPSNKCNNDIDRYLCKNQRCIFLNATCNENDDCGDDSDENIDECKKADSSCKQTAHCEHHCRRTPEGAQCACRPGYKLSGNRTCTDINECERYEICDQQCINTAGSYMCSCQSGYTLGDDKKTCKVEGGEALMVFSIKSEIRGFYLDSQVYYSVTTNLQHAVAVSQDANYVYWSDVKDGDEAIIKSSDDGSQQEVIVTTGLNTPRDLAVDWVTGNIYFTDSGYMHIGVCSNDGSYCTILIKEQHYTPKGLALLPSKGIMYWSEWGLNSRILMAGMDGRNGSTLIAENLEGPDSLSIDYANYRLYWIDSKLKVIESIRLDGSDRRIVLCEVAKKPFSLAVFENKLYWSDWISNTIQFCNKFNGKDWNILVKTNSTIYGLHIYHSVLKPKMANPCNSNPCSQLCLLNSKSGYTCACTVDKVLNSDQRTCRAVKKKIHLVVAGGDTLIDYYHELLGKPKMTESFSLKHVTALAYNPLTGGVLANDQLMGNILQFNTDTGDMKIILPIEDKVLGGMDFDYIGNNLYLSDEKYKTIEVYSMSTLEKTIFYYEEEPHDIALAPEEGIMFVVFGDNGRYRIDLMQMNGLGNRNTIEGMKTPLFGPKVSLAYDRDSKRLFWSDQGTGRIGRTTINGLESYIFRTGLSSQPVSLVVLDDYVFWTGYKSNQLHWTIKSDVQQYQKRIPLRASKDLDQLQLVALHNAHIKEHECQKNNGNCSHVCLLSNSRSHICACPPNMMLSVDNRTCSLQTACKEGEVKCSEHDVCIKQHQRCNGVRDCPNGEDESSVCEELRWSNCEHDDQFRCKSGECIGKAKRCNSHYDCTDRSDEEGCDKKECNSNEFQCHEGECISRYLVCNGRNDCPDLSDESNCAKHTCGVNDFVCGTGTCIPKTWKCDGERDCPDDSDENETCLRAACPTEMFTCDSGRCIDMVLKCNGVNDCQDNSDEQYCAKMNNNYVNCTDNEYKCYGTNMCLPQTVKCDGVQNCPKNDDERNCVRCQIGEYVCDNQKCIDASWVCDRANDCGDGSDEKDCDGGNLRMNSVSSNSNCKEFKCSNGVCLPFDKVCDRVADCTDQTDEFGQCSTSCTKENPCKNICYKTPLGPVCGCGSGYQLSNDLKSCEDIDECEQNICSQICHNTNGSFICSCHEEYVLRSDRTSCKVDGPQMELITVTESDIRKLSANLYSIEILYESVDLDISGIDVNAREGTVYWSNDKLGSISKIHLESRKRMIVTGLGKPESLAVDWITNNVYFNDNDHLSTIKVCNLEQQKCAKVVSIESRSRAVAIAVHPKQGLLFWSQVSFALYDIPTSKIYRSTTVGSNATAILSRNSGVIYAFTIDYMRSKLYWTDTFLKVIESSNLDGSNRVIFLKTDVYQSLSINIFEDALYWLMGTTSTVKKCKLYGDKSCTEISIGNSNIDKHFTILHTSRQRIAAKNVCEERKCSYMCISGNNTAMCICHDGYSKNDNCIENRNTRIKFDSSTANERNENSAPNRTLIGVIITMIACIIITSAYFYYQKIKPNLSNKNSLSIHFQNASYEHQNEIATSLDCISGLPPGEHEYVNPITDIQKNQNEKKIEGHQNLIEIMDSDRAVDELKGLTYKPNLSTLYNKRN
uniref:vitellogenin receptor isoform X1 n=1 Tax=Osmia lignaria TaxID=473952 RepID=UPI0014781913|nr:vitellogenin receptor isoform X1 [Osmia lignaria]